MAEVNTESKDSGKKGKPKKMSTRVDFTPMVDLGFLLITFFMLTTTLIKPQTMEISMPSKDKVTEEEQTKVKASKAITIILGKNNKVYYYFGTREKNVDPQVFETDFSAKGIRKVLIEKNISVVRNIEDIKKDKSKMPEDTLKARISRAKASKESPVVMIKASDESSYKDLVDILDEMQICNIGRYAIVDITSYDLDIVKKSGFDRPVSGKL